MDNFNKRTQDEYNEETGDEEAAKRIRLIMMAEAAGRQSTQEQEEVADPAPQQYDEQHSQARMAHHHHHDRRAQLLDEQQQQQQQQQPYLALESAQHQLALAIARQRQSEHDAFLRQHELRQAAAMVELAARGGGAGDGGGAVGQQYGFSDSSSAGNMFGRLPPSVFQQHSASTSTADALLPLHNQLRLEAALAGLDSSMLSSYVLPSHVSLGGGGSGVDPYLLQQAANMSRGQAALPTLSSMSSLYGNSMAGRNSDFVSLFGGRSAAVTNTAPIRFQDNQNPSGDGGAVRGDGGPKEPQRVVPPKSATKQRKKRSSNKNKLDVPYTDYDPGPTKELSLPSDKGNLSPYQCLLREQILLFTVQMGDIQCSAQGRNKPITLGQVGVLCRHCARIPPGLRPCGAVYFPGKLSGLYQASQNMAINHFSKSCKSIPEETRQRLLKLKEQKSSVLGGGKHFWANGALVAGVYESEEGQLRFRKENTEEGEEQKAAGDNKEKKET